MKETIVSVDLHELLVMKASALAVVQSINLILNDYELNFGQIIDLTEDERETLLPLLPNTDSPIAKTKTYQLGRCMVKRLETLALHFVILAGSMLPVKTAASCPTKAAEYREKFFLDKSCVSPEGLVLRDICLSASKSIIAAICFSYATNGAKYLPEPEPEPKRSAPNVDGAFYKWLKTQPHCTIE